MSGNPVIIGYTNRRGVRSKHRIQPDRIEWSNSEWHPETQWLLLAWDYGKKAEREFAMKDIHSWTPTS